MPHLDTPGLTHLAPSAIRPGGAAPAEIVVYVGIFIAVTILGLYASHWRRGNLEQMDEWGLAGRRFGPFVTWFLQGGSIYTTYAFIAVPGLVFGQGVLGFYALPYLVIAFMLMYLVVPTLWQEAKTHGYVTAADYVRAHFNSRSLAMAVAATGIMAMIPYVALQIYGIELCLSEIGLPVELSLLLATLALALITYVSGLRAAALIAIAKDVLIWTTVVVAVVYLPLHLGGFSHVFQLVPRAKQTLAPEDLAFSTLALGSGLALYLYPHSLTGSLSSTTARVVRLNAATLPVYTIMLGMLALLGYVGIAAGIQPDPHYGANIVVPELFQTFFPAPFAGFALAAISVGALIPASVMSIAAGSLFSSNIYREIVAAYRQRGVANTSGTAHRRSRRLPEETLVAKIASLVLKFLAVGFILAVPTTFVINFQLAGGVWILQTLPAVFLAPFLRFLDRRAVLAGWALGMVWGTYLLASRHFTSALTAVRLFGRDQDVYVGLLTLTANLIIVGLVSAILAAPVRRGAPRSAA